MIFLLLPILLFIGTNSQYSDLVTQMDGVFTKLNSNETAKIASNIGKNINDIIERVNSDAIQERTNEIFNNFNEILTNLNSNETKNIIHNLRLFTENSKVYIDLSDDNWNVGKLMIYLEIILSLIIIMLVFLFSICIYKVFKKRNLVTLDSTNLYNSLNDRIA